MRHIVHMADGSQFRYYTAGPFRSAEDYQAACNGEDCPEEDDMTIGEYHVNGPTYPAHTVSFDTAVRTYMEEHQVSRAHARQQVAGAEIDRLCKVYMADHRVDYPTAYTAVLSDRVIVCSRTPTHVRRGLDIDKLETLVNKALAIVVEMDEAGDLDRGVLRFKLAGPLYLQRAMEIAETTPKRLDQLEKLFERPTFAAAASACRLITEEIRKPEVGHPITRLDRFLTNDAVSALAMKGFHKLELMALASRWCLERHPGSFGPVQDEAQHEADQKDRDRRLHVAYAEIGKAITLDDLVEDIADVPSGQLKFGVTRFRFKRWPLVYYSPASTAPERLVRHLWEREPAKAA